MRRERPASLPPGQRSRLRPVSFWGSTAEPKRYLKIRLTGFCHNGRPEKEARPEFPLSPVTGHQSPVTGGTTTRGG